MNNMKTNQIEQIEVGYFCNFYDKEPKKVKLIDALVTIPRFLEGNFELLRNIQDSEVQKEEKKKFPMFTPSAVCGFDENGIGTRKHDFVLSKNNIIALDIDEQDNEGKDFDKLKNALFSLNYVYAVSKSIRGKGLFVIVLIEDINDIKEHYKALEDDFIACGIKLDRACKDLTRARYLSYDNEILIKQNCEVVSYNKKKNDFTELSNRIKDEQYSIRKTLLSRQDNTKRIYGALKYLMNELNYGGDGSYNDWIHEGFMISSLIDMLGYQFCEEMFIKYSMNTIGFKSVEDVQKKFKNLSCSGNKVMYDDTVVYYFGKLKRILGQKWYSQLDKYIQENINN